MHGFSVLVPSFVLTLKIFAGYQIGATNLGYSLTNGQSMGTITSVPGAPISINGTFVHMDDFFRLYDDKANFEVGPRGLIATDDGAHIGVSASGLVQNSPKIQAILAGEKNATPTEFGDTYAATTWQLSASGASKYANLSDYLYVGNFRLSPGGDNQTLFIAEYRLSLVTSGSQEKTA